MTIILQGTVRGRTIELNEDPGVAEGQVVEIRLKVVEESTPAMSEGLGRVYEVLGRRHRSGHTDTAQRHDEHQP